MSKIKFSDYSKSQFSVSRALADTGVFDSDLSQALHGTTIDRFFSKTEIARHVGKIGSSSYELPCDTSYIQEADPYNQANQLQVVAHVPIGTEDKFLTFKDFMLRLESLGVDIRKTQQWAQLESFNYVPPINLDKFSNFADYYWCPPTPNLAPEYITVANPTRQSEDKRIHLYTRNADFVGATTPVGASEAAVWFNTATSKLNRLENGVWVQIDALSYDIADVNTLTRSLSIGADLTRRLQVGSLIVIASDTTVAVVTQVASVVYNEATHKSEITLQYSGDVGEFRGQTMYVDPLLQVVLGERSNYTAPEQAGFRTRPTSLFAYSDLSDIVWAKYTSIFSSTTGKTSLGSSEFEDSSQSLLGFADAGVRSGDSVLIVQRPNTGLYPIEAITGDRRLLISMPNKTAGFFNQTTTAYSILRSRSLIEIISSTPPLEPVGGEYWVDTEHDVLRQYHPNMNPGACASIDDLWIPVLKNFSLLTAALGSRYISNYYPDANQWGDTNFWRHRTTVNTLGITDARQAQLPILEFNDGLELSEWRKTVHAWSYKTTLEASFKPTSSSPSLNELQTIDVYYPENLNLLSIGGVYGDRTSEFVAGTKFRIIDSIGGQLDGVYEVASSLFARYSDNEFRTRITLKDTTTLRAAFALPGGRIVPVETSAGDPWLGYSAHWRYDGVSAVLMTAPHQLSVRHLARNNLIATHTDPTLGNASVKVALSFQETMVVGHTTPVDHTTVVVRIDLAQELLERSVYNPIANNTLVYINGVRVTAYRDQQSTTSGGYVGAIVFSEPQVLKANDVVRIELGPVTNADIGRASVPVFNGTEIQFVDLTEFHIVPQIKAEINQYPLFCVYTATQEPVDRASSLIEYALDDINGDFNFWIQRRLAKSASGDFQFNLSLQDPTSQELFAFKDRGVRYTEQDDSEMRSVWYSNPEAPNFVAPEFVDRCGRPVCILNGAGDLNPEGFWRVPEFWTTNLVNETRRTLTHDALTSHFRSIIAAQSASSATPEESAVYFINSAPNLSLGGTIKMFNYGTDLTISSLMMEQTDPIDVIQNAHDAYETLLANIVEQGRRVFASSFGIHQSLSQQAYLDWVVTTAIDTFENNDELNRVYGDSFNSGVLRNFVDTLPAFGLASYVTPQVIDINGTLKFVHHDGHVSNLDFNIALIRSMLVNLIKSNVVTATKYLSPTGAVSNDSIPHHGAGSLVAVFVQPEYQTTVSGTSPPALTDPTIFVKREVVSTSGITTFETYIPTTFTVVNPERRPSPDTLIVFDPTVGEWKNALAVDLYIDLEKQLLLAIEQKLFSLQSTKSAAYNTHVVVPDTNWTKLQQIRFEKWVDRNGITDSYKTQFKQTDPFSWNYIGGVVRNYPQLASPVLGANWQAIYEHYYNTPYPHIEPWKLQHYSVKPDWWDAEYASTSPLRRWTEHMWFNVVYGLIPVGKTGPNGASVSTAQKQQLVAGYAYIPVNTTDTSIIIDDPYVSSTPQVYLPDDILPPYVDVTGVTNIPSWVRSVFNKNADTGLPETSFPNREAGYTFGARGPREYEWRRSSQYAYDQLIVAWQIDPIRFTYQMFGFPIDTIGRLQFDGSTNKVHTHEATAFHGDYVSRDSTDVVQTAGLGQWYINYIRAIRQDATDGDFRRMWTQWLPHLSYMFNRVIVDDTIQLTSPTAEIVTGDYNVKFKTTRELDILETAGLRVSVLSAPSKYSPTRTSGKGWEFELSSYSPFTNALTLVEPENYFVSPGAIVGDDSAKWYINRFDIVGLNRYTSRTYQVVNYLGGWANYTYLTSINSATQTFNVAYATPTTTETITITIDGRFKGNRTIGGLIDSMNSQLHDSTGTQIGTFALRNGNIVLYSFNRNLVGRLTIQPTLFFDGISPTDPVTGSTIGNFVSIENTVNGDSQEQTVLAISGNRTLVIEAGDDIMLSGTRGDATYTVDEVRYDFISGNTELVFFGELPLSLIAEGQAIKATALANWVVGEEVYFSSDNILPSPLSEQTPYAVAHIEYFPGTLAVEYLLFSTSSERALEVAAQISKGRSPFNMAPTHIVKAQNPGTGDLRVGKLSSTFQALQGAVVGTFWKRHKLTTQTRSVVGPISITGIQSLIDFVHGYEAFAHSQGFVFSLDNETNSDETTGRMKGWQLELERFISAIFDRGYETIEADNLYDVHFIDPSTLTFTDNAANQWLATTPIRLSRQDGNLPQVIAESNAPSYQQSVFYTIPDSRRRNAFKLAYTAADAAAGNAITFDVPLYSSEVDPAPYVQTISTPSTTVAVLHMKSETDLSKLIITYSTSAQPLNTYVTDGNTITVNFSEPVTGTISVAYAPTVYPSHTETLVQPALATSDASYAIHEFNIVHNFNDLDISRYLVSYNTTSLLSGNPIAGHTVAIVDANTLRIVFDEPPVGNVIVNVRPAMRETGGRLTARVIKFVSSFEASINPYAEGLWITTPRGIIRDVFENSSYSGALRTHVYNERGVNHTPADLLVLRQDRLTRMMITDGGALNVIAGARIVLSGIEHAMLLNDQAVDGSPIYDSFVGNPSPLLYIEFEGQAEQTFRANLGGYVMIDGKLVRNIEGMAEDLRYAYDAYETSEGSMLAQEARRSIGYTGNVDFLVDNNINKKSQFLFWKSMINHKGTHVPLLAFLRGVDVRDIVVDEFWAYELASFGSAGEQTYPEMNLFVKDGVGEELRIEFLLPQETVVGETFDGVRLIDTARWHNQPDVIANHPFKTFFLNAEVIHIDDTPKWAVLSDDGIFYLAPKNCDGIILFNHLPDGTIESYTVGNDITKFNNSMYKINVPVSDTAFFNTCTIALIGYGSSAQDVATFIDKKSGTVVDRLALWDPARGAYDQQGLSAVDEINVIDPASYNTTQYLEADAIMTPSDSPWLKSQVGRTWMDASRISHLPYSDDQIFPVLEDRTRQWGALEPWSDIHLYEWTESKIAPDKWDAAVRDPKSGLSGTPLRLQYTRDAGVWRPQSHKHETHTALMLLLSQLNKTQEIVGSIRSSDFNKHDDTVTIVGDFLPALSQVPGLEISKTIGFISPTSNIGIDTLTTVPQGGGLSVIPTTSAPAGETGDAQGFYGIIDSFTINGGTWTLVVSGINYSDITNQLLHIPVVVAMAPYAAIDFNDNDSIAIYINGVYLTTVVRPLVFDTVFGTNADPEFLKSQISLVREPPSITRAQKTKGESVEVFPQSTAIHQDELSGELSTLYYFWVRGKTINDHPERKISIHQATTLLKKTVRPYMIWQDLRTEEEGYGIVWGNVFDQLKYGLPGRYRQMIARGLNGRVTENDRYVLRFTRDFTLRDRPDANSKNLHREWKLFREQQTYKIDQQLWNAVTEAMIGHKLDNSDVLVPSLNRVLYDRLFDASTRFGLADGQAFVDSDLGLGTITYHITNETGPYSGFGGVEFVSRYDLTDSSSILLMMADIYAGGTVEQVNYLFFEVLQDALSLKREYEKLMKTSWVSLQIVRDLNISNSRVLAFDPPTGCLPVQSTTTTTLAPTPIDEVDVTGCADFTTTTTLAPDLAVSGALSDVICDSGSYATVAANSHLTITGGVGPFTVAVTGGAAPSWMTFNVLGNQIAATGTVESCNVGITTLAPTTTSAPGNNVHYVYSMTDYQRGTNHIQLGYESVNTASGARQLYGSTESIPYGDSHSASIMTNGVDTIFATQIPTASSDKTSVYAYIVTGNGSLAEVASYTSPTAVTGTFVSSAISRGNFVFVMENDQYNSTTRLVVLSYDPAVRQFTVLSQVDVGPYAVSDTSIIAHNNYFIVNLKDGISSGALHAYSFNGTTCTLLATYSVYLDEQHLPSLFSDGTYLYLTLYNTVDTGQILTFDGTTFNVVVNTVNAAHYMSGFAGGNGKLFLRDYQVSHSFEIKNFDGTVVTASGYADLPSSANFTSWLYDPGSQLLFIPGALSDGSTTGIYDMSLPAVGGNAHKISDFIIRVTGDTLRTAQFEQGDIRITQPLVPSHVPTLVLSGTNSTILTNSSYPFNPTAWIQSTITGTSVQPYSIIGTPGQYLAGDFTAGSRTYLTSSDLTSWVTSTITSTGAADISTAAKRGSLWILGDDAGAIFTSPDRITWTKNATINEGSMYCSAEGNGVTILGDTFGSALVTTDGLTWMIVPTGLSGCYEMMFTGTKFVIGSDTGQVATSVDGAVWTLQATGLTIGNASAILGLANHGNRWLVIARDGVYAYSTDAGANWTTSTIPGHLGPSRYYGTATYGNGVFIAVHGAYNESVASYSTDMITWTVMTTGAETASLTSSNKLLPVLTSITTTTTTTAAPTTTTTTTTIAAPTTTTTGAPPSSPRYSTSQVSLLGATGLNPVGVAADDASYALDNLPFTVVFFNQTVGGLASGLPEIYLGTNSYLTFGAPSTAYSISPTAEGKALLIGANDGYMNNGYAAVQNGGNEFRVRFEGIPLGNTIPIVWEVTFYADLQMIQVVTGSANEVEYGGISGVTDGTAYAPQTPLLPNTSYVFYSDVNGDNWVITPGSVTSVPPTSTTTAAPTTTTTAAPIAGNASVTGLEMTSGAGTLTASAAATSSTHSYWRLTVNDSSAPSDPYTTIAKLEMRPTVGGADQCVGGTATADSYYASGYEPANAFDADPATTWTSAVSLPHWIKYQFASPVDVQEIAITAADATYGTAGETPSEFVLEYSDDDVTWTQSMSVASAYNWTTSETRTFTSAVTWSPYSKGPAALLSTDNLTITRDTGGATFDNCLASIALSGKKYWEVAFNVSGAGEVASMGISTNVLALTSSSEYVGFAATSVGVNPPNETTYLGNTAINDATNASTGTWMFAFDADTLEFWIGTVADGWFTGDPATNTTPMATMPAGVYLPAVSTISGTTVTLTANFGSTPFAGTVPAGFSAVQPTIAASTSDPYFANVKSLMHFDNDLTDQIAGHTYAVVNSGSSIDTTTFKYGPGSLLLNGGYGAQIQAVDNTNFPTGTGDFTYECWVKATTLGNTGIFTTNTSSTHAGVGLGYYSGTGRWQLSYGQTSALELGTGPALTTGVWVHVFVQRISGVMYMGADGTLLGSVACTTNFTDPGIAIGAYYGSSFTWNGNIDEFRFTNGNGRYATSGTYAVPTQAFSNS